MEMGDQVAVRSVDTNGVLARHASMPLSAVVKRTADREEGVFAKDKRALRRVCWQES